MDTDISKWTDFIEASDHHFRCRCDKCRAWWAGIGPDHDSCTRDTLYFGPFSEKEIEEIVGGERMAEWRLDADSFLDNPL